MTRWWMLIFAGLPRDQRLYDHAREAPPLFWPLVVLAAMTALAGNWLGAREMIESSVWESREVIGLQAAANGYTRGVEARAFAAAWLPEDISDEDSPLREDSEAMVASAALARGDALFNRWAWLPVALGILAGGVLYRRGPALASRLVRIPPVNWIHAWLCNRMYFDDLYESLFVVPVLGLADAMAWLVVRDRRPRVASRSEPPAVELQAVDSSGP